MFVLEQTETYKRWFSKLCDKNARARIDIRLSRLARGNPGDVRFVGEGVLELKVDYGPGYRIYYMRRKQLIIMLLAGGDKRTQARDIRTAIELAAIVRNER